MRVIMIVLINFIFVDPADPTRVLEMEPFSSMNHWLLVMNGVLVLSLLPMLNAGAGMNFCMPVQYRRPGGFVH